MNGTKATNFEILYAYRVSAEKGYNLVNFNQYTIKNTVLMVDYYFNLTMGLPSKQTSATMMDIYLTGNGEIKSMDFKYNVTMSGFKIAYIYNLFASNQIMTQGKYNVTAAVSNSSLTAYAPVFINSNCNSVLLFFLIWQKKLFNYVFKFHSKCMWILAVQTRL